MRDVYHECRGVGGGDSGALPEDMVSENWEALRPSEDWLGRGLREIEGVSDGGETALGDSVCEVMDGDGIADVSDISWRERDLCGTGSPESSVCTGVESASTVLSSHPSA